MTRANDLAPNTGFPIVYSMVWYSLLNDCWEAYNAKNEFTPGEALLLDRQSDAVTRNVASVLFGQPWMKWSDKVIEVHKRLLGEREVALRKDPGSSEYWLSEIREVSYDASQILTIKASQLGSSLAYRGDGVVRLAWITTPEFSFTGQDTLLQKLKRGFEANKGVDLYSVGLPTNSTLRELNVICQPFNQQTAMAIQYFSTNPAAEENLPPARVSPPEPEGIDDQVNVFTFAQQAFPEVAQGKAPHDEAWITSLVFPPPQLRRKDGSYDDILKVYGTDFYSPRQQFSQAEGAQPLKVVLSLDPLVRVVAEGEGKQEVLLNPGPDTASWVLEGDRLGSMGKEGSVRYYYPPATQQPAVALEVDSTTKRQAAVITSLKRRFSVDVIKATQGGESAYATFATYYAPQTHYLKTSLENGKFKLSLWYFDADHNKNVEVAESDTEWVVAWGNGSISRSGVFEPAPSNPSPFTVAWARDTTSSRLLLWAFTVIPTPLYTPAEAVALFQN